jgi:hypothetical protein
VVARLPADQAPERALLALLFTWCMAAQGRPIPSSLAETTAIAAPLADIPQPTRGTLRASATRNPQGEPYGLPQFAHWTGATLGAVYERLLPPAARRAQGIYYTPPAFVQTILAATLTPLLAAAQTAPDPHMAVRALRILDPACGAGGFLVAALNALAAALAATAPEGQVADWRTAAAGCLYGVDRDPLALDLARYSLALAGADPAAAHWHEGDALVGLPPGWAGFDAVVGNPPYVPHRAQAPATRAAYRTAYQAARGQYDLSVLFIERGLGLLRPGGLLGYVVPSGFMAADYGLPVRELLARQHHLLQIHDLAGGRPFPGAAAYPLILVARATPPPPGALVAFHRRGAAPLAVAQAAYGQFDDTILPVALTPALMDLAGRIAAQPGRLPARAIRCGVARAGVAATALTAAAHAALPPADQAAYLPLIQTQDLAPYGLRPDCLPRHLHRDRLTARQQVAFAQPGLLVPGVIRRLLAAPGPGGQALGRVYQIAAALTPYTPEALLALLNSRVLGWYYRFLYWPVHLSGGYLRVNAPYLTRLPLPPPAALPAALGALAAQAATDPAAQAAIDTHLCAVYQIAPAELAAAEATLAELHHQP